MLSPLRWHLDDLALHLVATYLVFFLGRRLGLSQLGSTLGALFFGIHGANPEVVAWTSARFDELATCFVLLALLLLCWYVDTGRHFGVLVGTCLFALLSKEAAFGIPVLAACCLWYRNSFGKRGRRAIAGLCLTCVLVFADRAWVLGGVGGYRDQNGTASVLHVKLGSILEALSFRMWGVLLFPINWSRKPESWLYVVLLAFVACLVAAGWFSKPGRARVWSSVAFTLAAVLPASHLALVDARLIGSRIFHLSVIGFALLFGAVFEGLAARRTALLVLTGILVFQLSALLHNLMIWRDTAELARHACRSFPALVKPEEAVRVLGLPSSHEGVFFLANGFPDCVYLNTGRTPLLTASSGAGAGTLIWDEKSNSLLKVK